MTKTCSRCSATKPLTDFKARRTGSTDGYDGVCRACQNAARRKLPAFDFSDEPTNPGAPAFDDIAVNENVPDGHRLRGLSTLVGPDGEIKARWIKTAAEDPYHEMLFEAVRASFGDLPRGEPIEPPNYSDDDLLIAVPIGDAHFGSLAWGQECGEDFDLAIAERNLATAIDHLATLAPAAKHALIVNVGDFVHFDGLGSTTTKGTKVDADGRWPKVIQASVRALRRTVDRFLERHEHVTLWNIRGNHDDLSAMVLSIALGQFYENDPRVTVCQSPEMFKWMRFGKVLLGATHGDKAKPNDLLGVMVADRARDVGETIHRRIYCGHLHHEVVREFPGVTVETLRTLAGADAWHRGQGYRSGRDLKLDVFHREWGLINRHVVGIEQIRRLA